VVRVLASGASPLRLATEVETHLLHRSDDVSQWEELAAKGTVAQTRTGNYVSRAAHGAGRFERRGYAQNRPADARLRARRLRDRKAFLRGDEGTFSSRCSENWKTSAKPWSVHPAMCQIIPELILAHGGDLRRSRQTARGGLPGIRPFSRYCGIAARGPNSRTSTAIQEAVLSFLIPVYNEKLTVAEAVLALGSILEEFHKLCARRPAMSSSFDLAAR
jgi:hypothetical protein